MCFLKYTYTHDCDDASLCAARSEAGGGAGCLLEREKHQLLRNFMFGLHSALLLLRCCCVLALPYRLDVYYIIYMYSKWTRRCAAGGRTDGCPDHPCIFINARLNCTSFCVAHCPVQMSKLMKANRVTSYEPSLATRPISLLVYVRRRVFFLRAPWRFPFRNYNKSSLVTLCASRWKSKEMPPTDIVRWGEICCIFIVRGARFEF